MPPMHSVVLEWRSMRICKWNDKKNNSKLALHTTKHRGRTKPGTYPRSWYFAIVIHERRQTRDWCTYLSSRVTLINNNCNGSKTQFLCLLAAFTACITAPAWQGFHIEHLCRQVQTESSRSWPLAISFSWLVGPLRNPGPLAEAILCTKSQLLKASCMSGVEKLGKCRVGECGEKERINEKKKMRLDLRS